ncbi:hypothetical protein [Lysinibacillus fusiformis]|uniref:hypothetical protein n=1 Tax=Lysinibacillus fusiformis TaxID=28031 RepID=UPI00215ABB49|nr:hypothetical protein [Lysinibacillus fusiformis]MCR8853505.1 hypothetical protein [Lysinibacillus fusiformis]
MTKIPFSLLKTVFLTHSLLPLCIITFAVFSIKDWYPDIISLNNRYFSMSILVFLVYILYNTYSISKEIVFDNKLDENLADLKQVDDGDISLTKKMNFYLRLVEENKSKLEFYKSISPVSIIVFILGFIIKWDFNIFNNHLEDLLNFELEFNYYVVGLVVLFGIWYAFSYWKCWVFYKVVLKNYYKVKTAYEELELKKNNLNKNTKDHSVRS